MNWADAKCLLALHEKCADQIAAHGFSVTAMSFKGLNIDNLPKCERVQVLRDFERNRSIAAIGDQCKFIHDWCLKASQNVVRGPGACVAMAEGVLSELSELEYPIGSESRLIAQRVKKFLNDLKIYLSENYPEGVTKFRTNESKHKSSNDNISLGSIIAENIERSDQRAEMLGSRSLRNVFGYVKAEHARRFGK